jgi:KDO2-lipid IV(A) lauroyltransferase
MSRRKKGMLVQRLEYALYRLVAAMARSLSDRAAHRWGGRLGDLARFVLRKRDRLALRNLQSTFPEMSAAERRRVLDESWRHFGREAVAYIRAQSMTLDEIAERCPFVNAEILEAAIAAGHGVVLISAHFGGWEIGGLAITALVRNVRTVTRPLDNEFLERDLARIRARTGAEVVDRRHAARALLRALGENGVIVVLPDQAVLAREGVVAPFLGRPAWTTDAPAKLALRAGATIVFAFCIPDGLRHRLEFEEPIRADQLSDDDRNPVKLTARINDVISRRIAERPEWWLWMHDRWKGTAGESEAAHGE